MVRVLMVATLLLGMSGCDWIFSDDGPRFTDATALTPPWTELTLPITQARVTFSDAETLSVHHTDAAADVLGERYGAALLAGGWVLDADTSAGGIVNQTWSKDGQTLALSVQSVDADRVVSLSILPF